MAEAPSGRWRLQQERGYRVGGRHGVKVYGPPSRSKHKRDPYAARADDGPGVAAWRGRMRSPHGKAVYQRRARAECSNARFRNWCLYQFTLLGVEKATIILRWFA
jgi:hypothetical protein